MSKNKERSVPEDWGMWMWEKVFMLAVWTFLIFALFVLVGGIVLTMLKWLG